MAVDLSYLSATPLPSEETKRKTEEIKEGEKNKEGGTKGKKIKHGCFLFLLFILCFLTQSISPS